jgi:hypothetical protein
VMITSTPAWSLCSNPSTHFYSSKSFFRDLDFLLSKGGKKDFNCFETLFERFGVWMETITSSKVLCCVAIPLKLAVASLSRVNIKGHTRHSQQKVLLWNILNCEKLS